MERTDVLQQIYARLSRLEDLREETRINDGLTETIDIEIKSLRDKLQNTMNTVCPVLERVKNEQQ